MEWTTVTVLVVLIGLVGSIVNPIVKLTRAITKQTFETANLSKAMEEQKDRIHESFQKIWEHEETQDDKLVDHENRLNQLEYGKEK